MNDQLEAIIDALEYRVAQLEARVWQDSDPQDRKALERRKSLYYKAINAATVDA